MKIKRIIISSILAILSFFVITNRVNADSIYSSNEYIIMDYDNMIFTYFEDLNLDKITVEEGYSKELSNGKLIIKQNDEVVKEFGTFKLVVQDYTINNKKIIYDTEEFDLSKITVSSTGKTYNICTSVISCNNGDFISFNISNDKYFLEIGIGTKNNGGDMSSLLTTIQLIEYADYNSDYVFIKSNTSLYSFLSNNNYTSNEINNLKGIEFNNIDDTGVIVDDFDYSIDISRYDDKSVIMGTKSNVLYIQFHGIIKLSQNAAGFFSNLSNITYINGIKYLDTSDVTDMSRMFYYCSNLKSLDLSSFNTSNVTTMSNMFNQCINLESLNISSFDTSKVTDMSVMFQSCRKLKSLNISNFDTSNVTKMVGLFNGCESLESLDLNNFNTSNVTDMSFMFGACFGLKTLNIANFNTDNVTNMNSMFSGCKSIETINLSSFNTSNVTNMAGMFENCNSLTSLNLSNFNTSNVAYMSGMFNKCSSLTSLNLNNFNTSNVAYMSQMFDSCENLESLNISSFDTSNVIDMSDMFNGCSNLKNLSLTNFDTSKVTNMSYMFNNCTSLNSLDISSFNTFNVKNMQCMFSNCSNLKFLDLSNFYLGKLTLQGSTNVLKNNNLNIIKTPKTYGSYSISLEKSFVDINSNKIYDYLQTDTPTQTLLYKSFTIYYFELGLSKVMHYSDEEQTFGELLQPTKEGYVFGGWYSDSEYNNLITSNSIFENENVTLYPKWYTLATFFNTTFHDLIYENELFSNKGITKIKNSNIFDQSKNYLKVSMDTSYYPIYVWQDNDTLYYYTEYEKINVTKGLFENLYDIEELDLTKFDSSKVTDMHGMFSGLKSLKSLDLSHFDTSSANDMSYMFYNCNNLKTLDLSNFNTSYVRYMYGMFYNCNNLTSLDLSNFNTSNVIWMNQMFYNCENLQTLNVSNFDTSNATNMSGMFGQCKKIKSIDLSNFNTSKVSNLSGMFYGCDSLSSLDLSKLNIAKANNNTNLLPEHFPIVDLSSFSDIQYPSGLLSNTDICILKAPNSINTEINLKGTFVDDTGNKYKKLGYWDRNKQLNRRFVISYIDSSNTIPSNTAKYLICDDPNLTYGELLEPTREHYIFKGWYKDYGTFNELVTSDTKFDMEDLYVYAKWEPKKYIYVWKNYDGTILKSVPDIDYGSDISYDGDTPTKENNEQYSFSFKEWSMEILEDENMIVYTATYNETINKYTVTFYDKDGITPFVEPREYEYGTNIKRIFVPSPSKEYHWFDNWYLDKDFTEQYNFTGTITGDLNLYGKWTEMETTIELSKTSLDFGTLYQDELHKVFKEYTKVKNTGNIDVIIDVISPDSQLFSNFGSSYLLNPGEEITLGFDVDTYKEYSTIGEHSAVYTIRSRLSSGGKPFTIDLPVKVEMKKKPMHISYTTHVQNIGWQKYVSDGAMAGTSGKAYRLEGIKIKLENQDYDGNIEYRTHIQNIGWEKEFKKNDEMSGTSGKAYRLEAIEIKLTGEIAEHFDVYYRVHAENFGWLGWARNGEQSGTAGYAYRLEGIEIKLVSKDEVFDEYGKKAIFWEKGKGSTKPNTNPEPVNPDPTPTPTPDPTPDPTPPEPQSKLVSYTTHVQNIGWQKYVSDGAMAGTEGKAYRLEGIKIKLEDQKYDGDIEYRTHIQNIGWESKFKKNDEMSGTEGKAYRLEAIEIKLTGEMAEHYDVFYRVHAENFGWLGWSKNGEQAGTAGYAYRLEGIEIVQMEKGQTPDGYGTGNKPFYSK